MQSTMQSPKWDKRFLRVAREVSTWSKDPSAKVGAVAVLDRRIIATGYNGFPRGVHDTSERWNTRETKYLYVVHAEQNLIYNATHAGVCLKGATVYVYGLPACIECTKGLIQAGIVRILASSDVKVPSRWMDSYDLSMKLMEEVGVDFKLYSSEELQWD